MFQPCYGKRDKPIKRSSSRNLRQILSLFLSLSLYGKWDKLAIGNGTLGYGKKTQL